MVPMQPPPVNLWGTTHRICQVGRDRDSCYSMTRPPWSDPERWHPGMDDVFGEQFAERKDFRFIIKTHESLEQETFQRQMKETFSLLAGKGCVDFETVDSIQNLF